MDMGKIEILCKSVRRMRILGAVALELAYVADGTYDAFVDIRNNLRIVDIAAAKLILEECGCIVTDRYGKALNGKLNVLEKTSLIATCNSSIHGEIMGILEDEMIMGLVARCDVKEAVKLAGELADFY